MVLRNRNESARAALGLLSVAVLLGMAACGGGGEDEGVESSGLPEATTPARTAADDLPLPAAADTVDGEPASRSTAAPASAAVGGSPATADDQPEPDAATAVEPAANPTPPAPPELGAFSLQLGSFRSSGHAGDLAARLRNIGRPAVVEEVVVDGAVWHRVLVHGFTDRQAARIAGDDIRSALGSDYLIRRRQ